MSWSDLHDMRDAHQKSSTANYKYKKLFPSEVLQYWFTVAVQHAGHHHLHHSKLHNTQNSKTLHLDVTLFLFQNEIQY